MSDVLDRMKALLSKDRLAGKNQLPAVIKSQAYDMLSDFFELEADKLAVRIDGDENGFTITIKARAVRVI